MSVKVSRMNTDNINSNNTNNTNNLVILIIRVNVTWGCAAVRPSRSTGSCSGTKSCHTHPHIGT